MSSIFHEPDVTPQNSIKVVCSSNERRGYEKRSVFFVHPLFNGETTWPTKTHIVCRYEGEPFDSIPIPLPVKFDEEKNAYTCFGIFCSAACVKAFMTSCPVYSNAICMIWLKKIMCEVFNDFDDITEAPPVDVLIKHGGDMTIVQFRQFSRQKMHILTHPLPFFTCALAFELVKAHGVKYEAKTTQKIDLSHKNQFEPGLVSKQMKKLQRTKNPKETTAHNKQFSGIGIGGDSGIGIGGDSCVDAIVDIPVSDSHLLSSSELMDLCSLTTNTDETSLLPKSVISVPATIGNHWQIRGLRRPKTPPQSGNFTDKFFQTKPIQSPEAIDTPPVSKSMFQEYLESHQQKSDSQQQQQKSNSQQQQQQQYIPDTKQSQRRRGRPKAAQINQSVPIKGTLVSFMKQ